MRESSVIGMNVKGSKVKGITGKTAMYRLITVWLCECYLDMVGNIANQMKHPQLRASQLGF